MATSGAGNYHSKKDWFHECPNCHKKGVKEIGGIYDKKYYSFEKCKYCDYKTKLVFRKVKL